METQKLKIKNNNINSIMFNHYTVPVANQFTSFLNIVPKDTTNRTQGPTGQWEVNDDCEIEILSSRKIAIKKFKIDTWTIRRKTGDGDELSKFGSSFNVKVTGLDYVHKNVICHTEGSDIPDGFTKAYVGGNGENGGYNVAWYPGQSNTWDFEVNKYAQGLLIQGCMNYGNYNDQSLHMGRAPWDIGEYTFVTDGEVKTKAWLGIGCMGICIGLFGGVQNATSWGDNSNGAYRVYDISDHPIIIDLDIDDTINYAVDLSSKECWNMHLGNSLVYHKDKTIKNCWEKYGYASETYVDESGNTQQYGYIKVANIKGYNFKAGIILPEVSDMEENMENLCWNFKIKNTSFWENIRNWFLNNKTTHAMLQRPLFASSNIGGAIQLNLNEWWNEEQAEPQRFLWGARFLQGSNIEELHIVSENGCTFSSGNGLFLGSGLSKLTFESPENWLIGATDCSGMLSQCKKLTSYPYNMINWGANRSNMSNYGIPCTLMGYCFEYTPFTEIPSFNQEDRFADDNTMVFASHAPQVFNGCNSLKTIGPICDLGIVIPGNGNTTDIFNCSALEDVRIKTLNHGNWSFDGLTRAEGYMGNLPNLNAESITYLFENLADLKTCDLEQHVNSVNKSFLPWGCDYWNSNDDNDPVKPSSYFMLTNLRQEEGTDAAAICWTNKTFELMKIEVSGLQDGDRLEFGSSIIEKTDTSITTNGTYEIVKNNDITEGFKLYSTNIDNKSLVRIQIVDGYDPKNPRVLNANLYCQTTWDDKVSDAMVKAANNKGWAVYVGGTLKLVK